MGGGTGRGADIMMAMMALSLPESIICGTC